MIKPLIMILALTSLGSVITANDGSAADHIHQRDRHYGNFRNDDALREYQLAYDQDPGNFDVLVRMVRIHNDIGRLMLRKNDSAEVWYSKAVEFAEQLTKKFPLRSESYFWLALAKGSLIPFRGAKGKLDIGKEALTNARRAVELDPTFAPSYILLGIVYREGARLTWYQHLIANTIFGGSLPGTIEESEAMLRKALVLDSSSMFAFFELSRTYAQTGNDLKRKEALQACLELTPHNLREKDLQEQARRQLGRIATQ